MRSEKRGKMLKLDLNPKHMRNGKWKSEPDAWWYEEKAGFSVHVDVAEIETKGGIASLWIPRRQILRYAQAILDGAK